jgi:hypothetical protein
VLRDSAGVSIAESTAPAWTTGSEWHVGDSATVEIGGAEADTADQLFRVRGAVRLDHGTIVVANAGTRQLKFSDAGGRHLRSVGRQGGGPGEFQALSWLGRYGPDSLAVWDSGNRRVSVFDRQGTFVRSTPLNVRGAVIGAFGDGSLLIEESVQEGADGLRRNPAVLWHVSADGATVDSIGVFPGFEEIFTSRKVGSAFRISERSRPFGRETVFSAAGDGFVAGTQDRFEIGRYSKTGTLVGIVRLVRDNTPVTAADVAAFKGEVLSGLVRGDPQQVRRELDELPYPDEMPAYGEILVDDGGNLWVEEYRPPGDEQPRWFVFDTSGRLLGTVETPKGLRIFQIGRDFVLGVMRDELDVEHVLVYPLLRG